MATWPGSRGEVRSTTSTTVAATTATTPATAIHARRRGRQPPGAGGGVPAGRAALRRLGVIGRQVEGGQPSLHPGEERLVAAAERGVVGIGEVARLVLGVGVVERASEEVAPVDQGPAVGGLGLGHASTSWRNRSSCRLRRQNSTTTAPRAAAPATAGTTHTAAARPVVGGRSRMVDP